jgi:hypothetical protein
MHFDRSNKLVLIYSAVVYAVGLLVFGILWATIGTMSLFLGWAVGAVIGLIGYILVIVQVNLLGTTKTQAIVLAIVAFVGRMLLYAGGLLLAGLLTKYYEPEIFNIFTVFAGYLPPRIAIYITTFVERSKEKKLHQKEQKEQQESKVVETGENE